MDPDATHATNDHVCTIPETTNNNRPSSVTTPHIVGYAANQPNRVTHGPPIITTPAGMDPCCLLIVHAIHVEKTHHHPQGDHHTHHVGDFPQKNVQPPQNGHTATKRARANGTGGVKIQNGQIAATPPTRFLGVRVRCFVVCPICPFLVCR